MLYDINVETISNKEKSLKDYKGKVMLIVNTASKCGFTPQFEGLEELNKKYKDKGLEVLGFPCNQFLFQDPGSNEDINEFCQLNYGVTFDMFSKIKVNGKNSHELYQYLISNQPEGSPKKIKWNFTKFLVSKEGKILKRYEPTVKPFEMELDIEKAL
jgi:glutathione peroxidase